MQIFYSDWMIAPWKVGFKARHKIYSKLKNESYRSTKDSNINLNSNRDFIYGRRNVYNVIKIPDNKITKYLEAQ